jgi:ketosteroid isomerase-like protein
MNDGGASRAGEPSLPRDAVERIRASNDGWHRRDIEAALAPYADEIEWDTTDAWPDGRVYRGLAALRAYFEEVLDRWGEEEHRLEIEEILEVEGTSSMVVHYRHLGRSRSGIPLDARWVHMFEFREGQIVRARNFTSLDEAVESLGATELSRLWKPAAS